MPSDQEISQVLRQVQLGPILDRVTDDGGLGLDTTADWASILSLGEQQRLAFARYQCALLLTNHLDATKSASSHYTVCVVSPQFYICSFQYLSWHA